MATSTCKTCIKDFIPGRQSKGFFCSRQCYWKWMIGKPHGHSTNHVAWNKGIKGLFVGEKSGRWIKDRSKLAKRQKRNDTAYKEWRKKVWLRDNFKCKIDNPDCAGRLEAHHILGWTAYPELRYEVNNGITLCHFHHPLKKTEEVKLSSYFQNLINTN